MVEQGLVGNGVEVVAVGDLVPADNLAYLLKYDSTQGTFDGEVSHKDDETLLVNGAEIKVVKAPSPAELPWKELGVDVVIESTGLFTDGEKAKGHMVELDGGKSWSIAMRMGLLTAAEAGDMKAAIIRIRSA